MILNPNKTNALVVSRSRTVILPHGDLVLSGVSIRVSPNLAIHGVKFDIKFTFEDHVRGTVSRVSQRIDILRLVKRISVEIKFSVLICCYFAFVLQSLSIILRYLGSAVECHLQLLRWPGFVPIRVSCRCVIDVVWLGLVCCTRLIRTLITLFSELPSASTRVRHSRAAATAHPLEFEVSRCRTSQFARSFLPAQVRMWIDLPYTVFYTGTLDWFKGAVIPWLPPWDVFSFSVAQVLVVIGKQFINNFVFPTWACAAGFNNNYNNNIKSWMFIPDCWPFQSNIAGVSLTCLVLGIHD